MSERLVACAIKRNGVVYSDGFRMFWQIRDMLGDEKPHESKPDDEEGFWTTKDQFVSGDAAVVAAVLADQLPRNCPVPLKPADIIW